VIPVHRRRCRLPIAAGLLAAAGALVSAHGGSARPDAAAVSAVAGAPRFAAGGPAPQAADQPADPFPIRRVLISPDKLAPAAGGLRRLPRDEFEKLVRQAAAASAAGDSAPRLVEARYHAALTETGLAGSGEWRVANPGSSAALALDPLRLALGPTRWADGRDALLFRPAGGGPTSLWVDEPGPREVSFDWSARGVEEPGDLRFDLRLPAAPVAVLELDVPAGRAVVPAQSDLLVSGPRPARDPKLATWRIAFGGQSRLEFTVHDPGGAGQLLPLARAVQTARFDLAPGQAEARFEFDMEAVRGPADAWEFELDPALRVIDAAVNGREGWRVMPGSSGRPQRLVVKLREPAAGGRVVVTAVAPFPADGEPWPCPSARPVAAATADETVEIRLGPDVRLDGWDRGDFRPAQAAAPGGGFALSFKGTLAAGESPARRLPAVRARPAGPEFATTEEIEWRIEPVRSRLTCRFRVKVLRGPLGQIAFRLPPGFIPEPTAVMPDDPAATATPGANRTWEVEPSRPLAAGQTGEIVVSLRGPPGPPPGDPASFRGGRTTLPFPELVPLGAARRDGVFTIIAADAYHARTNPTGEEPRPNTVVVPYSNGLPPGAVTISPRRPWVTVAGDTTVLLDGDVVIAVTRLRPKAEAGEVGPLTVFYSGEGWDCSLEAGPTVVRANPAGPLLRWLPVLGGGFPVGPAGRLWHVTPPSRSNGASEIVVRSTRRIPPGPFSVPVPLVLGADQPELPVSFAGAEAGRFEQVIGTVPYRPRLIRAIMFRPRGGLPPAPERGWQFADLTLTTGVGEHGTATAVLTGRVTAAGGSLLPVELPTGAVVEATTVGGRWADGGGGSLVRLPVPTPGADGVPFEVRYQLPETGRPFLDRVVSPAPRLPGDVGSLSRTWVSGPGVRIWPTLAAFGRSPDEGVRVIDAGLPVGLGLGVAAVFAGWAATWFVGGPPRRGSWAVLVGLTAALGGAGFLVPDGWQPVVRPPLIVAIAAVAVGALRRAARPVASPTSAGRKSGMAPLPAAVILPVLFAAGSSGQAPGPTDVYVVPTPGGGESVYAPPSVLDRLSAAVASPLPPVVVAAADFVGRDGDGTASFDATFAVHCTTDGEHSLAVPLTGVRLQGMRLDGAPAFPDARPDGFAVAVRGKGRHELTARFTVPVAANGADREVRLGIPDVPAGRATFTGPTGARLFAVPTRRGDLRTVVGPAGTTVTADLGGGRSLAVRWRTSGPTGGRAEVRAAEACVWDLTEGEAAATAAFVLAPETGALARVRIEVPPGWEPGKVAVRPLDATAGVPAGVRSWALEQAADGWRTLTIGLQTPVEGRLAVSFKLFAEHPPAGRPLLRAPRAVGVTATESFVGVRMVGVTADAWEAPGLIECSPAALAQSFDGVSELELSRRPPARVYRKTGSGPTLRTTLHPAADPWPVAHDIVWDLGPRAEAEGTVRFPTGAALTRVEFEVPGRVAVTDVRAPELAGWVRIGSRVQVWFRGPIKEPSLRWFGTLPGYPVVPGKPPPEPVAVELPVPPGEGVSVRVRPADGWATSGRELTFRPAANAPPPRLLLYPPIPDLPVRTWQTVTAVNGDIDWGAVVEVGLREKRAQAFSLRVGALPAGAEVRVEFPPGVAAAEAIGGPGVRVWTVTVPAEVAGPVRVTVSGRLTGQPVVTLPVVDVLFAGVPSNRTWRWLVADRSFRPDSWSELTRTESNAGWPEDAKRVRASGGSEWAVAGSEPVRLAWSEAGARVVPSPVVVAPSAADSGPDHAVGGWLAPDSGRWLAAAGWVLGFGSVGLLLGRGPRALWPEAFVLLGLVAAVGAGSVFLIVSAIGALARFGWAAGRLFRATRR
jgi:hypothetical protein